MWFVVMSVTVYEEHCSYFSVMTVVRLLISVVCGYECYSICGKLQLLQCSDCGEATEQCGVWLSMLLHMWNIAG